MHIEPAANRRELRTLTSSYDLVVVGGGLSGTCAAIQAAREGLTVALVQDRPVLGGNASSEIRLWALGATSHMQNNNRWAREGGIIDEIMVENLYRNREGNPLLFDMLLIDKTRAETSLTILLDTAVFDADINSSGAIETIRAFNAQNGTLYEIGAPLFCDASGDGILGYLSGATYRIGAEDAKEFGEPLSPGEEYGELLGHTIYFYTKDAGRPISFTAPDFALSDITKIPRYDQIGARRHGCLLWWFEYGGRLDTVHDTAEIKQELWKVVYGVWDHIKNSGRFDDVENLTLEWVGHIPGKRESRRFEGDYMLHQKDLVEQRRHTDAISYGGWSIDLHPADGVYGDQAPCNQYHSRGVYQIPYRCLYSRNVPNLFLAGRMISASHVAFGSTRVMMTGAHTAQAIGTAAALCSENGIQPRALLGEALMKQLQARLIRAGQFIPHVTVDSPEDLCQSAQMVVSSTYSLEALPPGGEYRDLQLGQAMLLPASAGRFPSLTFRVSADHETEIEIQLRLSERKGNYTPEKVVASKKILVSAGEDFPMVVDFNADIDEAQYLAVCFMPAEGVSLALSEHRTTGILSISIEPNPSKARQSGGADLGIDTFEFWYPSRRPGGKNLAISFAPPLQPYGVELLKNSYERPFIQANAWVAQPEDPLPRLTLQWETPQRLSRVILSFDSDFDHPMESVQRGHPERTMPFCVKHYRLLDRRGTVLFEDDQHHQSRSDIRLASPITTDRLTVEFIETHGTPAALFRIQVY